MSVVLEVTEIACPQRFISIPMSGKMTKMGSLPHCLPEILIVSIVYDSTVKRAFVEVPFRKNTAFVFPYAYRRDQLKRLE